MGKAWTETDIQDLTGLYNKGVTVEEIAKIKGRTQTSIHKKLFNLGLKGRTRTKEHCRKLSEALKGHIPWNKGKKGCQTSG